MLTKPAMHSNFLVSNALCRQPNSFLHDQFFCSVQVQLLTRPHGIEHCKVPQISIAAQCCQTESVTESAVSKKTYYRNRRFATKRPMSKSQKGFCHLGATTHAKYFFSLENTRTEQRAANAFRKTVTFSSTNLPFSY